MSSLELLRYDRVYIFHSGEIAATVYNQHAILPPILNVHQLGIIIIIVRDFCVHCVVNIRQHDIMLRHSYKIDHYCYEYMIKNPM